MIIKRKKKVPIAPPHINGGVISATTAGLVVWELIDIP
jgi:hypothetical protein